MESEAHADLEKKLRATNLNGNFTSENQSETASNITDSLHDMTTFVSSTTNGTAKTTQPDAWSSTPCDGILFDLSKDDSNDLPYQKIFRVLDFYSKVRSLFDTHADEDDFLYNENRDRPLVRNPAILSLSFSFFLIFLLGRWFAINILSHN